MFGFFKKRVSKKDVIISNFGFNEAYNLCRNTYDYRLGDDFSEERWYNIMNSLLKQVKNGANKDELYKTALNGFEMISHNGSPRVNFEKAAQTIADSINKLKGEKFKKTKSNLISDRFNVNNIEESIRMSKENLER